MFASREHLARFVPVARRFELCVLLAALALVASHAGESELPVTQDQSWRMVEKKAEELAGNKNLDKARAVVLGKTSEIEKALNSYDLKAIQAAKINPISSSSPGARQPSIIPGKPAKPQMQAPRDPS